MATDQNKVAVNWNRNVLKQQTFKADVANELIMPSAL